MSNNPKGEVRTSGPSTPHRRGKSRVAGVANRPAGYVAIKGGAPRGKAELETEIDVPEVTPPEVTMVKGKKVIKVTSSQVSAAQARVAADQRLGNVTPSWIVRISKLGPRNPLG